jgi:hypothetical protein
MGPFVPLSRRRRTYVFESALRVRQQSNGKSEMVAESLVVETQTRLKRADRIAKPIEIEE